MGLRSCRRRSWRCSSRTPRAGGRLGLQVGELGVLEIEQTLGFAELPFELVNPALQRLHFASGRSGGGAGGIVRRGHQVQLTGLLSGWRALGGSSTTPRGILPADLCGRHRGRYRRDLGAIRHPQHSTRVQHIHVLFEGTRIGLVNSQHPTVRLGRILARDGGARCDRRQRLATLHEVSVTTRVGRGRRRRNRPGGLRTTLVTPSGGSRRFRASRGFRRRSGSRGRSEIRSRRRRGRRGGSRIGTASDGTLTRTGTSRRRGYRRIARSALSGCEHRRIEQHREFANRMATSPVHLDEESDERLRYRIRGLQRDDRMAIARARRLHLHAAHEYRPFEPVTREHVARSNLRLKRLQLLRRDIEQLDLRIERCVKRGQETDVSKTEGKRC